MILDSRLWRLHCNAPIVPKRFDVKPYFDMLEDLGYDAHFLDTYPVNRPWPSAALIGANHDTFELLE